MQGTKTMYQPFLRGVFALATLWAFIIPAGAAAQSTTEIPVKITVNNQEIPELRRFSYRTRLDSRADRIRNHVGDWPFERRDIHLLYSGKISLSSDSNVLASLLAQNKSFRMSVFATSPEGDGSTTEEFLFFRCRIVEKELQITRKGKMITTYFFSAEQLEEN